LGLCKNSFPGLDNVRFAHIRCLPESGLEFLLGLYKDSLNSAQTPVDWKRTQIVTILKPSKDPVLADSYRPLSLLSCIRKLFDRMLLLRHELWAEKSEILTGTQFSFRKGKRTTDCLAVLCRELKKVLVPSVRHLYFFNGQNVAFMRMGYKGLPQGSVLSPFMYNF
jgi:hypothetical protein